jgi:hypothetical protein
LNRQLVIICAVIIGLSPVTAFGKSKKKKEREKDHPNYERYMADEEYRSGRSNRIAGLLVSSIVGGIGGGILVGGLLWNACMGASEEDTPKCKRNARGVMLTGVVVAGAGLGTGIPLVSVGSDKMSSARRRIDAEFPVKDTDQDSDADDEKEEEAGRRGSALDGMTLAVRVLNLEF